METLARRLYMKYNIPFTFADNYINTKTNNLFKIKVYKTLAYTNALSFVLEHQIELIKNGHADPLIFINNTYSVVTAEHNDKIVGCSVYNIIPDRLMVWKLMTVVHPEYRRQGLAKRFQSVLEEIGRRNGCLRIDSTVHKDNANMITANKSNGMSPEYIRFTKNIGKL